MDSIFPEYRNPSKQVKHQIHLQPTTHIISTLIYHKLTYISMKFKVFKQIKSYWINEKNQQNWLQCMYGVMSNFLYNIQNKHVTIKNKNSEIYVTFQNNTAFNLFGISVDNYYIGWNSYTSTAVFNKYGLKKINSCLHATRIFYVLNVWKLINYNKIKVNCNLF